MPDFVDDVDVNLQNMRDVALADKLTDDQLAQELEDALWPLTIWRSWPEAVLLEAVDRLRGRP